MSSVATPLDDLDSVAFPGQGVDLADAARVLVDHGDAAVVADLTDVLGGTPWTMGPLRDSGQIQATVVAAALASAMAHLDPTTTVVAAGHSLGELAAAVWCGAATPRDALRVAVGRAALCAVADADRPGAMVSVFGADAVEVEWLRREALGADTGIVEIAVHNGPRHHVLSGDRAAIASFAARADAHGHTTRALPIAGAYHSPLLSGSVPAYRQLLDDAVRNDPTVPFVSSTTCAILRTREEVVDALARALVLPVRWPETLEALRSAGAHTVADPGPGRALTTLANHAPVLRFLPLRPR